MPTMTTTLTMMAATGSAAARRRAKKHRQVVRALFVRGLSLSEAAREVGYSYERARQIRDAFVARHGDPRATARDDARDN